MSSGADMVANPLVAVVHHLGEGPAVGGAEPGRGGSAAQQGVQPLREGRPRAPS